MTIAHEFHVMGLGCHLTDPLTLTVPLPALNPRKVIRFASIWDDTYNKRLSSRIARTDALFFTFFVFHTVVQRGF